MYPAHDWRVSSFSDACNFRNGVKMRSIAGSYISLLLIHFQHTQYHRLSNLRDTQLCAMRHDGRYPSGTLT